MDTTDEDFDESGYNAADELADLEDEALEAQYSTPQQDEDNAVESVSMIVEDVKSALKRTRDDLKEAMLRGGDGSQNPEVARRLFADNAGARPGAAAASEGYTGIGPRFPPLSGEEDDDL